MYSVVQHHALRVSLAPLLIVALMMPVALCLCSHHAAAAMVTAVADTACCKGEGERQEEAPEDGAGCCGASAMACACGPSLLQADSHVVAVAPSLNPSAADTMVVVSKALSLDLSQAAQISPPSERLLPIASRPLHQVYCVQIC